MKLSNYNFFGSDLRVVIEDSGSVLFAASDICKILGYSNGRKAVQDHCKIEGVTKRDTPTQSGNQTLTYISEPNLYRLVIKSNKTEAEPFEKWVMEEVLPSIRKNGSYSKNQLSIPQSYADALQLAANQAKQLEMQQKQIDENKPNVAFADAVSDSETDILMRDLAKLIAQNGFVIGEHRLYDWMVVGGYLEARKRWSAKRSKYETQYWPTQRAIDLKVFRVKETVIHEGSKSAFLKPTVKVNGKGQQYFINKFLSAT